MNNPCLETTTSACNHWLAVKCAVILFLDMSRKYSRLFPAYLAIFILSFFPLLLLLHPCVFACTPGLVSSPIFHFLQKSSHDSQLQLTGVSNGLAVQSSVMKIS